MYFPEEEELSSVSVEGFSFMAWSYSDKCAVEDEAAVKFNRFSQFSQWENEVMRLLFIRYCEAWPCSEWHEPVPCVADAKAALYRVQTQMCRKLVSRASKQIERLNQEALKNWQTGRPSGELTQ
jgi:tRNA uridine 5-carbamoylmethylation protein Kti12